MLFLVRILPLFLCLSLFGQTNSLPLWFSENFADNSNRWNVQEIGKEYNKSNAFYIHKDKPFKLLAIVDTKSIDSTLEYSFAVTWGGKDVKYYYNFEIKSNKTFRINYVKDGTPFILKETTKSTLIKSDKNQLEIERKGDELFFFINKTEVSKIPFQAFFGSDIELKSINNEVSWTKFEIYQNMGNINMSESVKTYKAKKENLGDKINSVEIEKCPSISPDGKKLYFIRENYPGDYGRQDIWYSEKQADGTWGQPSNAGTPLNDEYDNYVNSIMPDNNTLCVGSIYTTNQTEAGWSKPKPLTIKGLKSSGNWVSYFLSADAKTLVYTLKQPETFGGRDIYVSFLEADGNFSPPLNLGSIVNTSGNEHSPFLAADNKTLYFDSDGHPGYGGRDIFMSRRLDDSWKNWSKPENLGPAFNTASSDEGMMIPASGEYAYFVSNQNSKNGLDIFRLKLPDALKPLPTALVRGRLLETNSETGIPAFLSVYIGEREVATARTNPTTGEFQLILSENANYKVVIETKRSTYPKNDTFFLDIKNLNSYQERSLNTMFISKISDNVPSVISKVPFNFDFLNNKNTGTEQLNISKSNVKIPVEQNSNAKRAVEQNSNTNKTLEPNSTVKKTVQPSTNANKTVESNSKVNKTVETKKTELEKPLSSTSKTTVKKDTFNKTKVVDINSAPVIQPKDKSPVPSLNENVDPNQLHTVYFDFGVYTLSEEETLELNKIIQKINLNDNSKIELIGHTDCIGQEDENLLLSSLRIKSVEKFLIKNGVKAARINSVIAKGEKEPVADNNRSKGRAKNRRVEIIMR